MVFEHDVHMHMQAVATVRMSALHRARLCEGACVCSALACLNELPLGILQDGYGVHTKLCSALLAVRLARPCSDQHVVIISRRRLRADSVYAHSQWTSYPLPAAHVLAVPSRGSAWCARSFFVSVAMLTVATQQ